MVKELDGRSEESGRTGSAAGAMQINSGQEEGGRKEKARIQMGRHFGKRPPPLPDWPATETASHDPSSPARKRC